MVIGASTVIVRAAVITLPRTAVAPTAFGTTAVQLAGCDQFPSASTFQLGTGGASVTAVMLSKPSCAVMGGENDRPEMTLGLCTRFNSKTPLMIVLKVPPVRFVGASENDTVFHPLPAGTVMGVCVVRLPRRENQSQHEVRRTQIVDLHPDRIDIGREIVAGPLVDVEGDQFAARKA